MARAPFYSSCRTDMLMSTREDGAVCMSPMPAQAACQPWRRCRQTQETLQAVWVSVYAYDPARHAARDEGPRGALVSERPFDAPPRLPRAGLRAVGAHLG